jgi:upstream activation factor subunit UAF30
MLFSPMTIRKIVLRFVRLRAPLNAANERERASHTSETGITGVSASESAGAVRRGEALRHIEGVKMAKKTAKKSARKPNAAFMKPMTPSSALSEVVGSKPIPRTEVTKKLWLYIKKNKLQDQKNKRMIKADDALKTVFGGKATVNMFEMTKLVNKHLKA